MSLILDALNRADKERSEQQHAPNLHAPPINGGGQPSPVTRWVAEAVVVLVLATALVYALWFRDAETVTTDQPTMPAAVSSPSPSTAEGQRPEKLATATVQPELEKQQKNIRSNTDNAVARLYQQQQTKPPVTPTKVEKARAVSPAPTQPSVARKKPSGREILQQIPLLSSLSSRFQESVPNIDYSLHVYNEEENSGLVNLNGSVRKIGAEITPGVRLIAILPDSVVLDYNGVQFRLMALNSWVHF